jgi:hypothetical protein
MRNAARVHGFNITVPSKIPVAKCQNGLDAMHPHCRHQPRVKAFPPSCHSYLWPVVIAFSC